MQDALILVEKNVVCLEANCTSTSEEIEEIYRRITKAIKDRSDQLKGEIDRYLTTESRNLNTLKENIDTEISNITSNCEMIDKYMNDTVDWNDCELMDTKEIFLKTVEFLRHFEYESSDYSRRVRFVVSVDPNQLVLNLSNFGDLNIMIAHNTTSNSASSSHLVSQTTLQPGLMRSKSDHRLVTQFRQQEERISYNDEPVLGGRRFGERPLRINTDRYGIETNSGTGSGNRYGRQDLDCDNDFDMEQINRPSKGRFRSRFVRSHQNDDSDGEQQQQHQQSQRNVNDTEKRKDKVRDGEDASRGQLSGIIRLSDCARVMQRLADIGKEKKEKKTDTAAQAAVQAAIQAQKSAMQRTRQQQQQQTISGSASTPDDEISQLKRQNKIVIGGGISGITTATLSSSSNPTSSLTLATGQSMEQSGEQRPAGDRVSASQRNTILSVDDNNSSSNHYQSTPVLSTPSRIEVSTCDNKDLKQKKMIITVLLL